MKRDTKASIVDEIGVENLRAFSDAHRCVYETAAFDALLVDWWHPRDILAHVSSLTRVATALFIVDEQ